MGVVMKVSRLNPDLFDLVLFDEDGVICFWEQDKNVLALTRRAELYAASNDRAIAIRVYG